MNHVGPPDYYPLDFVDRRVEADHVDAPLRTPAATSIRLGSRFSYATRAISCWAV
jgi:hypothetical protein